MRKVVGAIGWVVMPVALWAQNQNADPRALAASAAYLNAQGAALGLTNPAEELRVRRGRKDDAGVSHIRYDQYYRGVRVFEGEAITHVDATGAVSLTNSIRGNLNLSVAAGVRADAALATVVQRFGIRGDYQVLLNELQVLPRGARSSRDALTWHVRVLVENEIDAPAQWDAFVDASSGALLFSFDSFETAKPGGGGGTLTPAVGVGRTMYLGDVVVNSAYTGSTYQLKDLTRNGNYVTDMAGRQGGNGNIVVDPANDFGNYARDTSDPDTAAADAGFGAQSTHDYYKNMFGRNGIDGAGRVTYSRVHFGINYQNAYWSNSCFCMTYGDGGSTFYPLVSLDVAGHEMSHGVMSTESNLTYSGESGGLNEANSDIFGTMVEFAVANANDAPDYWIGERIYRANWPGGVYTQTVALRYMDDPARDGRSPACWSSSLGSLNVHYSSGPANHMFYLLAEGGTSKCNANAVSGVGREKAARIWYRAITDYMTASTNYAGARTAALNAATALYGAGSAERNAVAAAFSAINVN